jgi:hypothetical protein
VTKRLANPLAVVFAALVLPVAATTTQAETVMMPHGLTVELPQGWRVDGPDEGKVSKTGLRRIQLICESEACEKTQETCTVLMRTKEIKGSDDASRLRALYASPLDRYFRLRAVLRSTSKDAEIRKPLEIVRMSDREWYRVETDARHNYKSGLFAETIVNGLYVGLICKTCETGEERHQGGLKILMSLKSSAAAASLR